MVREKVVENILAIPKDFYGLGNLSINSLLQKSGYYEHYQEIDELDIYEGLKNHPEFIDEWISWAENKRSDSGWYLKLNASGTSTIGYFPTKPNLKPIEYRDVKAACAGFIKREIEEIREQNGI